VEQIISRFVIVFIIFLKLISDLMVCSVIVIKNIVGIIAIDKNSLLNSSRKLLSINKNSIWKDSVIRIIPVFVA
jgi:hypothetical protein